MVFFNPAVLVVALSIATNGISVRSEDSSPNIIEPMDNVNLDPSDLDSGSRGMINGPTNSTLEAGATPTSSLPVSSSSLGASAYNGTWSANITSFSDSNCTPQPYNPAPMPLITLPSPNPALATIYRYRRQQGVNLGAWFMLEGWMTPSLFSCATAPAVSEHDVATGWNGQARHVLEKHWDTFVTESDFIWMAGLGINTVRLPLGYWHIGTGDQEWMPGTLYEGVKENYAGAWPRVLRAISWAEKYGIGVLVDLHGAPGSQNGQHHSGVSDGQTNLFSSPTNMQKTISVLQFLTKTFLKVPNIVGIQLLNEPINVPELFDFYTNALNTLRGSGPAARSFPFYVHDAFDLNRGADFVRSRGREWNVLDHHSYYVFTPYDNSQSATSHTTDLSLAGSVGSALMEAGMGLNGNLVIGEWSCALSDVSLGVEENPISSRRQFCEVQEQTYRDIGAGAAFWSLTKENCEQDPAWCFKSAVGNSLPSSFFSYEGLLVDKDLSGAVGAGFTSQGTSDRGEGGGPQPSSSGIQPSTWAAVASASAIESSQSTIVTTSDTAVITATAASDDASPSIMEIEVPTTLEPESTPRVAVADVSPESDQLPTPTVVEATSTPSTFLPMRRSRDDKSGVEARDHLPSLHAILSHTDRSDANTPVGIINMTQSAENDCYHHGCLPKSDGSPLHAGSLPSRPRRQWNTREHMIMSIHKRRNNFRRGEAVSASESTDFITSSAAPASQYANTQFPEISAMMRGTPSAQQITPFSNMEVLKNGTVLHINEGPQLTLAQQAIQQGFSDGFMTAKMFAQQGPGMSRLGFKWQYVEDSLAAHGSTVSPGREGYYKEWFEKGLTQGEAMVAQVIARMNI